MMKGADATGSDLPGVIGWCALVAGAAGFDVWAIRTQHPTLSRTLGRGLAHPLLGPILAGAWAGLSYHLLIEELLPAWIARRQQLERKADA